MLYASRKECPFCRPLQHIRAFGQGHGHWLTPPLLHWSECESGSTLEPGWVSLEHWNRVWHSWKFRHVWISEYIRINKFTRTNVRIYSYKKFDTNECPNKYSYWKLYEYSNIFEYSACFHSLLLNTLMNECPNIFIQTNLTRTNVRIYW